MKNFLAISSILVSLGISLSVCNAQTTNYISRFDSSSDLIDSKIYDNGTNIGINTNNPSAALDVQGTTLTVVRAGITSGSSTSYSSFTAHDITNNKSIVQLMGGASMAGTLFGANRASAGQLYTNSAPLLIGTGQAYDITFGTNNTFNMVIKNGGNIGIGTTSPTSTLTVKATNATSTGGIRLLGYTTSSDVNYWSERQFVQQFGGITKNALDANGNSYINGGNVGIGTTSPLAKLHINNGSLLLDGTTGNTPTSGAGTRLMWIPAKYAFRAGQVLTTEWDDANIGIYSVAIGGGPVASAYGSVALGLAPIASGNGSVALGQGSTASGDRALATGSSNTASGSFSAAFNVFTTAQAYASSVMGRYNVITGSTTTWVDTDPLFVLGNGTSTSVRSNAITVLKNGKTLVGNPALSGFMGTPDGYLLFVQQGILAEKVKVALANSAYWADYVFDNNYELKSISDLESYIKTNKHLPNIPSADEVVKTGIDMATMDAKLLEKIEELSLYIIEQNKRIEALEKSVLLNNPEKKN